MNRSVTFASVVAVTAVGYLLVAGPSVGADNEVWGRKIVGETPQLIWASSHFGQVTDYFVLEALRWFEPTVGVFTAMRVVSFAMGLIYLAALALLATTVPRNARVPLFVVGALSPITVFLHGEEEIPYYPFAFLLLAAALWRRLDPSGRERWAVPLAGLGGIAAAFHGVGLFFLPGIVALRWGMDSMLRSARERVVGVLGSALGFFGPTGVLFILYVLVFPGVTIFPGDATGGAQQRLFVPLLGTIPAVPGFRAYAFFSLTHLQDVALLLAMGAPALVVLVAWAAVRRDEVRAVLRADAPLWVMAGCGLVFVLFFYAGVSVLVTQSILVPALSLAQVLATLTLTTIDPRPWRRSFPILIAVTIAATTFAWTHAGTLSR